jgi:chromate transporter
MTYLTLFYEFFKIGLFAIGGGPATLPFLMELTKRHDWFTMSDLTNMVAVSESTPGPLGINMATYAGFHAGGIPGGIVATMGLVFPSIVVIIIIAKFLTNFSDNPTVNAVFAGIRPAVTALIASAVLGLFQVALMTENGIAVKPLILCVVVFALMHVKKLQKLHPAFWLLAAAVVGIIFRF